MKICEKNLKIVKKHQKYPRFFRLWSDLELLDPDPFVLYESGSGSNRIKIQSTCQKTWGQMHIAPRFIQTGSDQWANQKMYNFLSTPSDTYS